MYLPSHFAMNDVQQMHELMVAHPLATLVTTSPDGLTANHIPLLMQPSMGEAGVLQGHVARANPLWKECAPGSQVLAIFQGAQSYITPSWYPSKKEHGKVVPTWNYVAVHVRGTLQVKDDARWVRAQIEALTRQQEAAFASPWAVGDAPDDYIERMVSAIVGIEITITELIGKSKVSQNQPPVNKAGVVNGLQALGSSTALDLAKWVKQS